MVTGGTEWAHPQFGPEVNLTIGIKDGITGHVTASNWLIGEGRGRRGGVGELGKGRV